MLVALCRAQSAAYAAYPLSLILSGYWQPLLLSPANDTDRLGKRCCNLLSQVAVSIDLLQAWEAKTTKGVPNHQEVPLTFHLAASIIAGDGSCLPRNQSNKTLQFCIFPILFHGHPRTPILNPSIPCWHSKRMENCLFPNSCATWCWFNWWA